MANELHRTTKQYLPSVNTPDYPPLDLIIDPDLSQVIGYASKYWKITGDTVSLMTPAEGDAVDAAEAATLLTGQRSNAQAALDTERDREFMLLRALLVEVVGALNVLRTWDRDLKTAFANATSLATLQSGVAALPTLANITAANVRTAIKSTINSGGADD